MIQVKITETVPYSKEQVWELFDDVGKVVRYHPDVKNSPVLSSHTSGIGAKRRCEFYDGTSVVETVRSLKSGERVEFDVSDFQGMPLKSMQASVDFKELGPAKTELTFTIDFEVKFGIFGVIMGHLMMKPMMKKRIPSVTQGVETHLKTGKIVAQKGKLLPLQPA